MAKKLLPKVGHPQVFCHGCRGGARRLTASGPSRPTYPRVVSPAGPPAVECAMAVTENVARRSKSRYSVSALCHSETIGSRRSCRDFAPTSRAMS